MKYDKNHYCGVINGCWNRLKTDQLYRISRPNATDPPTSTTGQLTAGSQNRHQRCPMAGDSGS